ncbi:LysR substrate-binding domain-containing protein [Streptomyces sp. TG1A-8]|uniref:LysR substrate-binding domain-containing protein n=1 Tax=Streptomyces sp. TG1A-8 TaxID=3051385 RepID=UPI00265BFA47|nr:LysR substrate-binding domain-containing protein [Streptomyces sp. TG1A-8]MDO0924236.1 LysR substrate-binding domain-containing protein [Streptomyces sp. TG1A-8]
MRWCSLRCVRGGNGIGPLRGQTIGDGTLRAAEWMPGRRLVVAVRPGHPLAEGPLSLERYAAAEHLTVSRRGRLRDPIDDALATHGHERRVVAAGPTVDLALRLAPGTDLVLSLPDAVTRAARDRLGLITLPLPLPMPAVPLYLLWHQRHDDDRAHAWLRDLATETVRALFAPPAASPRSPTSVTGQ